MDTRKPNLRNLTEEGIPKDFAYVMEYFNSGLEKNKYPFIPRTTPITIDEIKNLWVPSINKNIVLVAEENGKVIGQGAFYMIENQQHTNID